MMHGTTKLRQGKTVHYVNLTFWRKFVELTKDQNCSQSKFFCDSLATYFTCRLVGMRDVLRKPGSSEIPLLLSAKRARILTVLSPYHLDFFESCQVILPKNFICTSEAISQLATAIPKGHLVAIGISSPKQNELALMLNKLRADLNIICVGAVVGAFESPQYVRDVMKTSNTGTEWLVHFKVNPTRFIKKGLYLFLGFFQVLLFPIEFRSLAKRLEKMKDYDLRKNT